MFGSVSFVCAVCLLVGTRFNGGIAGDRDGVCVGVWAREREGVWADGVCARERAEEWDGMTIGIGGGSLW